MTVATPSNYSHSITQPKKIAPHATWAGDPNANSNQSHDSILNLLKLQPKRIARLDMGLAVHVALALVLIRHVPVWVVDWSVITRRVWAWWC